MVNVYTSAQINALIAATKARVAAGGASSGGNPSPSAGSHAAPSNSSGQAAPSGGSSSKGCLMALALMGLAGATTLGWFGKGYFQKRADRNKETPRIVHTDPHAAAKAIYDQKIAECEEMGDLAGLREAKQEYEKTLEELDGQPSTTNKVNDTMSLTPEQAAEEILGKDIQRCLEKADQDGIRKAIENYEKTMQTIRGKSQTSKPKPLTTEQLLCAAAEARSMVVSECLERGDFNGANRAEKDFNAYCCNLLQGMSQQKALNSINNACAMLEGAAEASGSALTIARNTAEIDDIAHRTSEVAPSKRQADAAEANARTAEAGARVAAANRVAADQTGRMLTTDPQRRKTEEAVLKNSEVKWKNNTLEEQVMTPKRVIDGVRADTDAVREQLNALMRLRDTLKKW